MIHLRNVCLSYGDQIVFDDLNGTITAGQRIGLVGRNGSGKSTLLKAIAHHIALDSGAIACAGNKSIAYMPQEVILASKRSLRDEVLTAFGPLQELLDKARTLEQKLDHTTDPDLVEQYATIQEQLISMHPDQAQAEAERMLSGLGFKQEQFDQPVQSLSVGWKMRVVLAKLLLQKADFYLFDEPTNHLDLGTKEWFLSLLQRSSFGFLLVCHERYFMDELCTSILELELGKVTWYTGNYSHYLVQKEHNLELLQAAHFQQQKDIKKRERTIERFRASASKAKMAKSMEKKLETIERITLPPSPKDIHFSFPPVERPGRVVLAVNKVSQQFGHKLVFQNVTFEIEREQKVAIVAANGVGKTTLFNLITGALPLQTGTITLGSNVTATIFAQDQSTILDAQSTIIDAVKQRCPKQTEQRIRTMLGSFLFSGDDVLKKIGVLSGGEKNRVGMTCVLLNNTNLLLLDEPTNHLDIPSKEILLSALRSYQGTLIFVSHDRDFVNDLATHILELSANGAHLYHGTYESYRYQKAHVAHRSTPAEESAVSAPPAPTTSQPTQKPDAKEQFELRKQVHKLERMIEQSEKNIATLEAKFNELTYGTPAFNTTQQQLTEAQKKYKQLFAEWEQLHRKIL